MPTSRSLVGIAVAALAVTLAAGAAATTHATPGLRVQEYAVPAGTHPHDVAAARRRDGLVHGPAHRQARLARPEDGADDGDPARGWLGAARRHRRARRRGVGDRRRAERDRPRRPRDVRGPRFRLPASTGYANLNTATFDRRGILWFTGQSGIYGRLDPKTRRDARLPRAARRRAVRDHDDAEGPRLLRLARGEPHRADRRAHRQGDRDPAADGRSGRPSRLVGLEGDDLGQRVERRQGRRGTTRRRGSGASGASPAPPRPTRSTWTTVTWSG